MTASCLSKIPSTVEKKEFILDFTRTLIEADIPLEKDPKFAAFLKRHCKQGGSIPAAFHLRSDYLPELFPQYLQDIKEAVQGQAVYIIVDETTDACGRYMKKAYNTILQGLFPNSRHVTCLAHLINLVLKVFPDVFGDVNQLCALVKKIFCQAPQRRLELRAFMQEQPVFDILTRRLEETTKPSAATIFSQLEDLQMLLEYGRTAEAEDWRPGTRELLKELVEEERLSCSELFQEAMAKCSARLQKHPCINLFKVLPVLDPSKVSGTRENVQDYVQAIPALSQVSTEEWRHDIHMDKRDAAEISAVE
ncbi:hypothetical protein SKAU_G00209450 [Synaphobranchus kaupii]|uniref:DUF659 domain-containing protein n=1 Tax=Synaphobranchus kaupii TaxID=118154 RepID=A0A9Q1F8L7_SYNKA|nr:hypothetical protein SKAU_G00209450 [Synaphobranchus kaupii]